MAEEGRGRGEGDRASMILLARVRRPQGLKGELRVEVLTDFPEHLTGLRRAYLALPGSEPREVTIESVRPVKDGAVLLCSAARTISEAETLRGAELLVPGQDAWPLPAGSFYHFELVGCELVDRAGRHVGVVSEVTEGPNPLLRIVTAEEREVLIPFSRGICSRIEPDRKRIEIDPPDGLLELNAI